MCLVAATMQYAVSMGINHEGMGDESPEFGVEETIIKIPLDVMFIYLFIYLFIIT